MLVSVSFISFYLIPVKATRAHIEGSGRGILHPENIL
jgi:hypothetical protein